MFDIVHHNHYSFHSHSSSFLSSHSLSLPLILVHPHTNFISSTHYNTINIDEPRIKITTIAMQSRKISGRKQHLRFMPWALCACNFWYTNFRQTNRCERKYDRKNKCKIAKSSIWVFFLFCCCCLSTESARVCDGLHICAKIYAFYAIS